MEPYSNPENGGFLVIDPSLLRLRFTSFPSFEFSMERPFVQPGPRLLKFLFTQPSGVNSCSSSWQDSLQTSQMPLWLCAPSSHQIPIPSLPELAPFQEAFRAQPPWASPSAYLWPLTPVSLELLHDYCICPCLPLPVISLKPFFPPGLSKKQWVGREMSFFYRILNLGIKVISFFGYTTQQVES